MNDMTNVNDDYDDGFGHSGASDRLIRGTFIRWTDATKWTDRDGMAPPETMLVIAIDEAVQRWENRKVIELIRAKPLPDIDTLNASTDKNTWEMGIDNKPKPPWAHAYVVYLLDPSTATTYTYINSTTGARIAYDNLNERVTTMRLLRGSRVAPLIKLDERPMKTNFGMRKRPEFAIVGWRMIGGGTPAVGGPQTPQLPTPDGTAAKSEAETSTPTKPEPAPTPPQRPTPSTPPPPATAQTKPTNPSNVLDALPEVKLPSVAEEIRDEIPW